MKKAKIVLSAVALFAVVGGAFAFKASRTPDKIFYRPAAANGICSITTTLPYVTTAPALGFSTQLTTVKATTSCRTYVTNPEL